MLEKSNYKVNREIDLGDGMINGQGVGNVSKMRYGLFPMSYNGCEMIALYNLLKLKGYKNHQLAEITLEMYKKVWVFWGIFGSNVYLLDLYFRKHDVPFRKSINRDKVFSMIDEEGAGVICFWNRRNPFKGIHTVCVEKIESGYRVYNRYNSKDYPYEYKTVDEVVERCRFMCGYTIKDSSEKQ